jgi:two-component system LytT family response regulator
MKVLIVDDEPVAQRGLRSQLDALAGITCVGACGGPTEAIQAIADQRPHVVLLDIKLGGSSAFDIIEAIGVDAMPLVIFVTAFDRHALKAFEVHALDYVLKPVDPVRLREALERAATMLAVQRNGAVVERLEALLATRGATVESMPPSPAAQRFVVRDGERVVLLETGDIDWFESAGNWVHVHSRGRRYVMRMTMDRVAHRLTSDGNFVRVRRSAVLNVRAIATFERYGKGTFVVRLRDGTSVISSRFYLPQVRRLFRTDPALGC